MVLAINPPRMAALLTTLVVGSAASGFHAPTGLRGSPMGLRSGRSPLAVELVIPGAAKAGDTVPITLTVKNQGRSPLAMELVGRPVAIDVVVTDSSGAERWRRLRGGSTGMALRLLTLAPGATRGFTVWWNQTGNDGLPLLPGAYLVTGFLPLRSGSVPTPSREFRIIF